jgi:hypothetical protein
MLLNIKIIHKTAVTLMILYFQIWLMVMVQLQTHVIQRIIISCFDLLVSDVFLPQILFMQV